MKPRIGTNGGTGQTCIKISFARPAKLRALCAAPLEAGGLSAIEDQDNRIRAFSGGTDSEKDPAA